MRKLLLTVIVCLAVAGIAKADEGMWLPNLIGNRIHDMQEKGFRLTAEDIYSINQASLKDGIVRFGRGCTGELISGEGLLLTNHHCGHPQIQSHSSVEHDYLKNGFWAMSRQEELPNAGLTVTFLVMMDDVTDRVTAGTDGLTEEKARKQREKNIEQIVKDATSGNHYTASVESFYYGNQYFLFVDEVYRDIRLVGAPPSSVGSFGGDTDNWMWPRHTGDFSLFRIYAGKDNKPAEFSKENVPYKPRHYFPVSSRGISEGDFTMVYGFPGSTQQYLHSAAVSYILNDSNPMKIALRTERLDVIREQQEQDPAIRIAYAAKAAGIANAWKKWQGESLGLERLGTIEKKKQYEEGFARWAADKPEYSNVLGALQNTYDRLKDYMFMRELYIETFNSIELTALAARVDRIEDKKLKQTPAAVSNFYKDYKQEIDRRIAVILIREYLLRAIDDTFIPVNISVGITRFGSVEKYVDWLFDNTFLTSPETFSQTVTDAKKLKKARTEDPYMVLYTMFSKIFDERINSGVLELNAKLAGLYKTYVKGMMEYEPERIFFPDANLTLRVAYGSVEGYTPRDGEIHLPVSTIEGIMQKDNPEVYDYDIPQLLRDIYASGDYGRWELDGTLPVNFLATNHTTGGNSGSPVLNGSGELVGINFDRTWLSTMSDIEFDPAMCRNIAVDIRYVLFVIDKLGGAGYLFDEMDLR